MAIRVRDRVHYGIGGAGNSTPTTSSQSPVGGSNTLATANQTTQSRKASASASTEGRRYSTGIGGQGNISFARKVDAKTRRRNRGEDDGEAEDVADDDNDEEMMRLLCDRAAPGIVLVEGGFHTGIGGFANKYRPSDVEDREARENNQHMRKQSLAGLTKQRRSSMAMYGPQSGDGGRRGSLSSMKDFVLGRRGSSSKAV